MQKVLLIICGVFIAGVAHAADTCVRTTFNVTYTCNGGTLVGTLPADKIVEYGQNFTPTAITKDMCTPPDGYTYAGQAIIVDGQTVASLASTSVSSSDYFTYYFTTDIEIGPHWVPVADPTTLAANLKVPGRTSTNDKTTMTWTAEFWYGWVSGIAKCSSVKPQSAMRGFSSMDQVAIENSENDSGNYCYCKMTQPEISGSPWVYVPPVGTCVSSCAKECAINVYGAGSTSLIDSGPRFRASVFRAAVRTAIEQAQQSGGNTAE